MGPSKILSSISEIVNKVQGFLPGVQFFANEVPGCATVAGTNDAIIGWRNWQTSASRKKCAVDVLLRGCRKISVARAKQGIRVAIRLSIPLRAGWPPPHTNATVVLQQPLSNVSSAPSLPLSVSEALCFPAPSMMPHFKWRLNDIARKLTLRPLHGQSLIMHQCFRLIAEREKRCEMRNVTIYNRLGSGFVATFVFCLICLTIYAIK